MDVRPCVAWFLVLACSGCLVSIAQGELEVHVDISHNFARRHENISVLCEVTGAVDNPVVIWFKEIRTDSGEIIKEVISTNEDPSKLYKLLNRFHITKIPEDDGVTYKLTIDGVMPEDSGHYGCYVAETPEVFDSERLDVYKQPYNVSFTNYSINAEGKLVMNELEPEPVECNILGVMPSPDVRIWVGDTEYTDQFMRKTNTEVLCEGSSGSKENCPLHFHYNVHMYHPNFFPSKLARDQRIKCQAIVSHSGFDHIVTTMPIQYEVSPKFECEHTQFAYVGATGFALECKVSFNPEVLGWTWTFKIDGTDNVLRSDEDPGYSKTDITPEVERIDDKSMMVSLKIKEVTPDYFTHYKLEVFHPLGNNSLELDLEEMPESPPPSSASFVTSSVLVFLSSAVLYIIGLC